MGRLFIEPARVLVTLLLLLTAAPVLAASAQALAWLDAQRQADGIYHTADSVALEPQVLTEILLARAAHGDDLAATPASIWTRFSAWAEADTEFLAGWIRAAAAAGHDHAVALGQLRARQNEDGGFADQPDGPSTVLATAFALQALHAAGVDSGAVLGPAVGFLMSRARSSGGWAVGTNISTVYTSALALQALAPLAGRYNLVATIDGAVTYLLNQRVGGGAYASDWETAHALLALMPVLADPGRYGTTLRALDDAQDLHGSWSDDPYPTALAVRALSLAERLSDPQAPPIPPAPTHGTMSGTLVGDADGAPLSGAQITVQELPELQAASLSTGRFELALPAGEPLTLVYQAAGYLQATQPVMVAPGEVTSVGTVRLTPMPDHGRLFGMVSAKDTGAALATAVLRLSGDVALDTPVGGDGAFDVALPGGNYAIAVEAPGYHPVAGSLSLQVGQAIHFAPVLVPESEPLDGTPAAVMGVVQNAETGAPLAGVSVEAPAAGLVVLTDAAGRFHFEGLVAGSYTFSLSRDGYHGASIMVGLVPSITADLGIIALPPVQESAGLSTVVGVVVHADDGAPVPGARASAGAQSTTTDGQGQFRLEGITEQDFSLLVTADGFASREYAIQLPEPGTLQISVGLTPYDRGGLRLSGLRAAQPAYEAHSEASLEIDLANTAQEAQIVRLYLEVNDPSGDSLGEQPVAPIMREEGALDAAHVTVEPGGQLTERFSWFTEAHPPGDYRLSLRAYQAFNGELLGERSLVLRILETRRIELVSVRPNPLYLTQGAVEEVGFDVLVQHRSNVPFPLEVTFQLADPQAQVLHTGTVALELRPEQTNRLETLEGTAVDAALPGAHPIEVFETSGYAPAVVHGQPLYVAPGTRVEIRQRRTPGVIAPDGSNPIDIEIKLEGKDQ
ncbi:carboxypeptidase regulatory-like domain-containing protein [Ectothiorhodospiraceae bacterium 2226]|nr:carboxypeptidase regulatory-like domain-containing protein [Ectothiorhodospiraceae bacterium 2226]